MTLRHSKIFDFIRRKVFGYIRKLKEKTKLLRIK